MKKTSILALALAMAATAGSATLAHADRADRDDDSDRAKQDDSVQLGPRPFFLVNDMREGPLKSKLQACSKGPFKRTDFSIGHRGACMQFPEHTRESYEAAARMGAGPPPALRGPLIWAGWTGSRPSS